MSTITDLNSGDNGAVSRTTINDNFDNLNADKVEGQSSSVDSEIALFSGTGGKTIKRATGSGLVKVTSGVLSTVTAPSGAVVGDTDAQTLTNKTLTTPTIGSFANANHSHQNSAGGAQLNATSVFSAGTVPTARLGSGTANSSTFLRGDQTWAAPTATFTQGVTTRDMTAASGNQTIAHGGGATPKFVRITALRRNGNTAGDTIYSHGIYNGTTTSCIFQYLDGSNFNQTTTGTTNIVEMQAGSTGSQVATVTVDGTNITLAWTKVSTPTGTASLMWEAIF